MSSKDDKPRTVPKFGSFKTKAPIPEAAAPQAVSKGESQDVKRHKSRHRNRDRDRHHSHRSRSQEPNAARPAQGNKDPADEIFALDKRGDPLVIRYGSHDRSQVPVYRGIGRGIVLGSTGYLQIHQEGNREVFDIRTAREGKSAFRDKNLLALASKTESRLFKSTAQQRPSAADQDFIPIESSRKRKRGEDEEPDPSSDREHPSYRSIEGKAKPHDDTDSAFESDSDDDNDAENRYMTPAKKRSIELSRTLKDRPDDIQSWLELIGLQDELFRENEETDHVRTRDEVKALAGLKLSMLEKALPHATGAEDREKVLVCLMREGSRVWKSQTLAKRWADTTEQNPESFALWKSRIDFELSNISTFSYDDIKQHFIDRLRRLQASLQGEGNDMRGQLDIAEQGIYVFLRLTRFLHEAGFVDLAVGTWQAMLELHFNRPKAPEYSRETAMASLGEFWDSEVPRIGETGAKGWHKFVEDGDVGDMPEAKEQQPRTILQTSDVYKAWAATERQQALEARMPARTVDEGMEDDPYRAVMFADIEQLLLFIPSPLLDPSGPIRKQLVDAYLMFCYLPPAFSIGDILRCARNDPFVYGGCKNFETTVGQPSISTDMADPQRHQHLLSFNQDGSLIAISHDVLFPGPEWFSYLISWRELYPQHDEPVERQYVLTTVCQLVRLFQFGRLGEYHLALEWLNDPARTKKVAKEVLKQYPSNVAVYYGYALAEWASGNHAASRKILESIAGHPLTVSSGGQLLKNISAWIELESTQLTSALTRVCVWQMGNTTITPALVLKAKTELTSARESFLSSGSIDMAADYAVGLALLNYLRPTDGEVSGKEPQSARQGDITAAMTAVRAFSADLASRGLERSPIHEKFLQFAARLIYYHTTHGPYRPIYVREQLQRFVKLFPRNTIFLSLFARAESSLRIDDPVRRLLRDTALSESHDSVSNRIFAIRYELQVGNVHSVKAAFESAVESEACRTNSRLWTYYIRFCYSRKEMRAKAKDVFYRAIAACPGSKALFMEAFTTLIREMSSSELKAVYSTVSSKGLRVHVDLEDYAKEWRGGESLPQPAR